MITADKSAKLGVNIDHVATLREARGTRYPSPLQAALVAEQAGADGITLHLREDRRHIQDKDVFVFKDSLKTVMNLEMAITDEMCDIALAVKPEKVCLVPEKREELTTEGGLDVVSNFDSVKKSVARLAAAGIEVSLFIDPAEKQMEAAKESGAGVIEIHTGAYADVPTQENYDAIKRSASFAHQIGLQVNAGHGLHYHNVTAIAALPEIVELNIGHAIVAHALFVGFENAVREMKTLIRQAR